MNIWVFLEIISGNKLNIDPLTVFIQRDLFLYFIPVYAVLCINVLYVKRRKTNKCIQMDETSTRKWDDIDGLARVHQQSKTD